MKQLKIAVCAICKNEKPYIEEWVAFYKVLGFDSVYVYDNVSDDGTSELLMSLEAVRQLKRIHWPREEGVPPQRAAYSHFLHHYASSYDYVLVCDIDEFLSVENRSLKALLLEAEARHKNFGAIAFPWLIFGAGGAESQEEGLVIERFTQCENQVSKTVKTMFNPQCTYNMRTHICDLTSGSYLDNRLEIADWDPRMPIRLSTVSSENAVMHHYYTKSREEWVRRRAQPKADRARIENKRIEEFDKFYMLPAVNSKLCSKTEAVKIKLSMTRDAISHIKALSGTSVSLVTISKDWIFGLIHGSESKKSLKVRCLSEQNHETFFYSKPHENGTHVFAFKLKWTEINSQKLSLTVVGSDTVYTFSKNLDSDVQEVLRDLLEYFPNAEEHNYSQLMSFIQKENTRGVALSSGTRFSFPKYEKLGKRSMNLTFKALT